MVGGWIDGWMDGIERHFGINFTIQPPKSLSLINGSEIFSFQNKI